MAGVRCRFGESGFGLWVCLFLGVIAFADEAARELLERHFEWMATASYRRVSYGGPITVFSNTGTIFLRME